MAYSILLLGTFQAPCEEAQVSLMNNKELYEAETSHNSLGPLELSTAKMKVKVILSSSATVKSP